MSQRVLLVEADGFAGVHQVRLAQAGYTVKLVTTPAAAVGAAHGFAPDLVILDVDLVGHNERELASQLRATSTAPLLLLVPTSAPAETAATPSPSHVDYLIKPFTAASFLAATRRVTSAQDVPLG